MGHNPITRRRPLDLRRQPDGSWTHGTRFSALWEVVCPACGDDRGPFEDQPEYLQDLRGPYPTYRDATWAAARHMSETGQPAEAPL